VHVVVSLDIAAEAVKKKRRATKKPYSRSIVGATLEVIQKKRAEKPEVRDVSREAALWYGLNPQLS
jgi:large subunit ribosomal protein L24e